MDAQTHSFAVRVAIVFVGLCAAVGFGVLAALAFTHDSAYSDWLFWLTLAALGTLIILIVGAPVVLAVVQALGLRLPVLPPLDAPSLPSLPASIPTRTAAPVVPAAARPTDVAC